MTLEKAYLRLDNQINIRIFNNASFSDWKQKDNFTKIFRNILFL